MKDCTFRPVTTNYPWYQRQQYQEKEAKISQVASSDFEVIQEEEIESQISPDNLKLEGNQEYKAAVVGKYM